MDKCSVLIILDTNKNIKKIKDNTNKNLADMHADGVHFDPKTLAAKKNNSILQKENLKKDTSAQKSN